MTIPIAIFIGIYMQFLRPGKIKEGTIIGVVLTLLAVVAGPAVQASPTLAPLFTINATGISIASSSTASSQLPFRYGCSWHRVTTSRRT